MNDVLELAREVADLFVWLGDEAINKRGRFVVALSGGTTPKILYATLAGPEFSKSLDWSRVVFFFGDERCVPPDHPESNFNMANAALFEPRNIHNGQIFRMRCETAQVDDAAVEYENLIRKECQTPDPGWPKFDLVLLGLGEDGHTASLFPGTRAVHEQTRLVVANQASQGIRPRLTLTLSAINHARNVVFLVTGKNKAGIVRATLEERSGQLSALPAALVQPKEGRLLWFLDQTAASELKSTRQNISSREE